MTDDGARSARRVGQLALAVALVAVGMAGWGLLRPPAQRLAASEPHPSDEQIAAAKTRACEAFDLVVRAVSTQTNIDLGADPVAQRAVAGNARLASLGGGDYLRNSVGAATPIELAHKLGSFADLLQTVGMYQLVEVTNSDPAQTGRLAEVRAASVDISKLCR